MVRDIHNLEYKEGDFVVTVYDYIGLITEINKNFVFVDVPADKGFVTIPYQLTNGVSPVIERLANPKEIASYIAHRLTS